MFGLAAWGLASQYVLQGNPRSYSDVSIPHRQLDDSICPAHVPHFTGSIGLSHGKELFYWLYSSASDPENDPLVVWLTGGPGGASTLAAVTEVGPCFVNVTDNSTYHNPYHWAQKSNLLVIDQPAGVGFSKASRDPEHQVRTLETATDDFVEFLRKFLTENFPSLSKNVLHIAGESYGGRWAPAFMDRLATLAEVRSPLGVPNPLGSIVLVNAVIGVLGGELSASKYEFGCTPDGAMAKLGFGFNSTTCDLIQELAPQCESFGTLCESTGSLAVCKAAMAYCSEELVGNLPMQSRNPYNVAKPCNRPDFYCIDDFGAAIDFFNNRTRQEAMGIDYHLWAPIDLELGADFYESGATSQSVIPAVMNILNSKKIRVLVMNGDLDALVTTAGQIRVFDKLPWRGQIDYRQQRWTEWTAEDDFGVSRGLMKGSTKLKFVTFEGAGHMVPGDDPRGASAIFNEWLKQ